MTPPPSIPDVPTVTRRRIDIADLKRPSQAGNLPGPAPMLQWLEIADLRIDPAYQRDIRQQGQRNIERIAAAFRWAHFSPVIVSPIEGGKFAIIDGQHRVHAAALTGIQSVPCQVIIAGPGEQAAAFRAINATITRMSVQAIHRAAVAAGDPEAVALQNVAKAAGVVLLPYAKGFESLKPGETLAVGAARKVMANHGAKVLELAFKCITGTSNNVPGAVNALTIGAIGELLGRDAALRDRPDLLELFEQIEIEQEAPAFSGRDSRGSARDRFADHLAALLAGLIAERARQAA